MNFFESSDIFYYDLPEHYQISGENSSLITNLQYIFKKITVNRTWIDNFPRFYQFLIYAIDYYNFDMKNIILSDKGDFKGSVCEFWDGVTLNFMPDHRMNESDEKFLVLHELGHIKQIQEGRLTFDDNKIKFEGKYFTTFLSNRDSLPFEADADKFALTSPLLTGKLDFYKWVHYNAE